MCLNKHNFFWLLYEFNWLWIMDIGYNKNSPLRSLFSIGNCIQSWFFKWNSITFAHLLGVRLSINQPNSLWIEFYFYLMDLMRSEWYWPDSFFFFSFYVESNYGENKLNEFRVCNPFKINDCILRCRKFALFLVFNCKKKKIKTVNSQSCFGS